MWIRRVKISGTPFERGHQLGKLCRREVENTLDAYKLIFRKYAGLDENTIRELASPFIDVIADYDVEIMEEIVGIAKALDRPLEDLVAINARTELMFTAPSKECTAIALLPEVVLGRKTLLGQNWDWIRVLRDSLILLEIKQPRRPTILMVAEAGIVGKIGMNRSGIGVCLNILSADGPRMGVPIHIMLRAILNTETLGDALGAVLRKGSGGCSHFLIASKEGEALGMEVGFHNIDVVYPDEGMLTHANHFVTNRPGRNDLGRLRYPDSLLRDHRALRLLRRKKRKLSVKDLQEVLRDHGNYPHAICRHAAPGADELEEISSLASIIMDLASGTLYISEGPPCEHRYVPVAFS